MGWINLVQDKDNWQAVLNTAMNHWDAKKKNEGTLLTKKILNSEEEMYRAVS